MNALSPAERVMLDQDAADTARYGEPARDPDDEPDIDALAEHPNARYVDYEPPDDEPHNGHYDAEAFWDARPALAHLRDFARSRRVSPWAMLGVELVRLAAAVKPFVVLPALTGSYASLNLYVALVGRSGAGKDTASAAARDALDVGEVVTVGIGSGEGILDQFARWADDKDDERGGQVEIHTDSVIFSAAEVGTLGALKSRQSSTLMPEFRKAWIGDQLGHAYRTRDKRLILPPQSYRLGLIVGVQPDLAGILLDDDATASGDPQRFVWMPATDPDAPDIAPDEPGPMVWQASAWPMANSSGHVVLSVCDAARRAVDGARLTRLRGDGEALDGHALLCRLKVAALLGILDGRADVTDEDWTLAGMVMTRSDSTRQRVRTVLADKQRRDNRTRGEAEAERAALVADRTHDAALERAARNIRRKLTGADWVSRSELRRSALSGSDRGNFDAAIARLDSAGQLDIDDEGRGTRYRLAERAQA